MPKAVPEKLLPPEVWRGLRREWLWVYHGEAPTTLKWSGDILVPPGIFFVERGSVRIRADGAEIDVPQGHVFFSGPGIRQQWFAEKTLLLSTGLRCTWPDSSPLWKAGLNCTLPTIKIAALHKATRRLFKAVHPQASRLSYQEATQAKPRTMVQWAAYEAAFQAWFTVFADSLAKLGIHPEERQKTIDRHLQRIVQWLEGLPLDDTSKVAKAPSNVPLGPRRVDQLLQEHLGLTTRAYMEKRRLDTSQRLLLEEKAPLKEIAFELGFRHASHFTAWFRRATGMSPSAFRENGGGCAA